MHRGEGLSHFLRLADKPIAAPETLAPLEGHHSLGMAQQDSGQYMQGRWVASSSSGGPPKVVTGNQSNPLLEEDHLRILLGDVNSELMMRVQRAALALEKLWELVDTDEDGLVNYYETKNLYAKWSGGLASEVDKHLSAEEKSSESKIDYKRFIDIFMPLALTVPPELIFNHLSQRFTAVSHVKKPAQTEDDKRRVSPRKSIAGSGAFADLFQAQTQGNQTGLVGENLRKAGIQRKKSQFHIPDMSVDGNARSSIAEQSTWIQDKMKASLAKINAVKRISAPGRSRASMGEKRATVIFEEGSDVSGEPMSPRSPKGSALSSRRSNPVSPTSPVGPVGMRSSIT